MAKSKGAKDTSSTQRPLRAAAFGVSGRMVLQPPVSREKAENEFGAVISECAWRDICRAFVCHGERLADLEVTKLNDNKNDKQGWAKRKSDAEKGLGKALDGLTSVNKQFLAEAAYLVSLSRRKELEKEGFDTATAFVAGTIGLQEIYNRAFYVLTELHDIVLRAEPLSREIMTEAQSRKALARDVYAALEDAGAKLSNGWGLTETAAMRDADEKTLKQDDLSNFERLAYLLKIHKGKTPMATAKWLYEALVQDR